MNVVLVSATSGTPSAPGGTPSEVDESSDSSIVEVHNWNPGMSAPRRTRRQKQTARMSTGGKCKRKQRDLRLDTPHNTPRSSQSTGGKCPRKQRDPASPPRQVYERKSTGGKAPRKSTTEELRAASEHKQKMLKDERKRRASYSIAMYKALQEVHPGMAISSKSMDMMTSSLDELMGDIMDEASEVVRCKNRSSIGSREIQAAVRLMFPSKLAEGAVREGTKAVTKYVESK